MKTLNRCVAEHIIFAYSETIKDMIGELHQPCNMPEAPKPNFFKNLFIGAISNTTVVDREELCEYRIGFNPYLRGTR